MDSMRIILSGLWVAVMLTYLLGDVIRIFAGDIETGKLAGGMWLLIAVIMLIPILMLVLTEVEVSRDSLGKHDRRHIGCDFQPHWLALQGHV